MNLGIKLNTSTNQKFFLGVKKAFQQLFFQHYIIKHQGIDPRSDHRGFQPWQPLKEAFEPGSGRRHWGPCLQWWAYRAWWASWWPRCVRGEGLYWKKCVEKEKEHGRFRISFFFLVVVRW